MIVAGKDQLQGWKEIASFLGRDERTAKRWEKQRGLPVRRIPGAGRANVYAVVAELDSWLSVVRTPEVLDLADVLEFPAGNTLLYPDDDPTGNVPVEALVMDPPTMAEPQPSAAAAHLQASTPREGLWPGTAVAEAISPFPYQAATPSAQSRSRLWLLAALTAVALAALTFYETHPEQQKHLPLAATVSAHSAAAAAGPYRSPQPHADELYLQGVYLYEERTPESLNSAREAFEQALHIDPQHAPAYAGLAQTYLMLREYATMPSDVAYEKAQQAAQRAVALDPASPDAHACLGFIAFFYNWNPQEARSQFQIALQLEPNSALARHWFGSMLTHQGKYAEALVQLNAAQRLQPTSSAILASRAYALGLSGERASAEQMVAALIHNDPIAASPHRTLVMLSQIDPADYPTYLKQMTQFADLRHDSACLLEEKIAAAAYASGGPAAMWQAVLRNQQKLHPDPAHPSYLIAVAQANLHQDDAAVQTLTRLVQLRSDEAMGLRIEPAFATLRRRADYARLMHIVGVGDTD